jgi:DNA polymerase-3 subunit gamma/tau
MVLIRLAYVADLPPPGDLVKAVSEGREPAGRGPSLGAGAAVPAAVNRGANAVSALAVPRADAAADAGPQNFRELLGLFEQRREAILRAHLYAHAHLVQFEPGRVQLGLETAAPRDLVNRVAQKLSEWTGQTWLVGIASEGGEPTIKEQDEAREHSLRGEAARHPLVRAVLDAFPGARMEAVRDVAAPPIDEIAPPATAAEDDEGDPLA